MAYQSRGQGAVNPLWQSGGGNIRVTTNMFKVHRVPSGVIHQYSVIRFKVEKPNSRGIDRHTSRRVFLRMQEKYVQLFTPRAIYDGVSLMYWIKHVEGQSFEVDMNRNEFIVQITPTTSIENFRSLLEGISGTGGSFTAANTARLTALQVMLQQAPNVTHRPLKRNSYYSDAGERNIGGGLVLWRGFFQSIRPALNGLYINIDTSTAAVYRAGALIDLAMEFSGARNVGALPTEHGNRERFVRLERFLKNLILDKPKHNPPGNWGSAKKISGLVDAAGFQTFDKDGRIMTVQDYFKETYGYRIQYPQCFGVRVGQRAIFPAEVCRVSPGQLFRRRLEPEQQRDFIRYAVQAPLKRLGDIKGAVQGQSQVFSYNKADWVGDIDVSLQPEQITGKVLPAPQLRFGNNDLMPVGFGAWNVARKRYCEPRLIECFAVISFVPHLAQALQRFVEELVKVMKARGIGFKTEHFTIQHLNPQHVTAPDLQRATQHPSNLRCTLIIFALPSNAAPLKRQLKFICNTQAGIATQCVRQGKFETGNDQYCNNVALKINAKIGGVNSKVSGIQQSLRGLNTMIVGCDVSHPGPGEQKPSIASLVASVDPDMTVFTSYVSVQPPRQEFIDDLGDMFFKAANDHLSFHNQNVPREKWRFPLQHVIVYRDGVSEGEYANVQNEILQIQEKLTFYAQGGGFRERPRLTFLVVTKRHHIRFFMSQEETRAEKKLKDNCPAGLVVDSEVVHPEYPNFYLQSHSGLIGTSCPSHYIVLKNESEFSLPEQYLTTCAIVMPLLQDQFPSLAQYIMLMWRVCSTANWLLDTEVDLEASETGSTKSADFDLGVWRKALKPAATARRLYFL